MCGEGNYTFYAGAFDWKTSAAGSLNVDIYENDLELLEGDAIGSFKRISKPIERMNLSIRTVISTVAVFYRISVYAMFTTE